jgi:hypothetical protein
MIHLDFCSCRTHHTDVRIHSCRGRSVRYTSHAACLCYLLLLLLLLLFDGGSNAATNISIRFQDDIIAVT